MTQVYNYFALPPRRRLLRCGALVSNEALTVTPADLDSFAARALPRLESVFEDFFRSYEEYRADLALYNAVYGPGAVGSTMLGSTVNERRAAYEARLAQQATRARPGTSTLRLRPQFNRRRRGSDRCADGH